MPPPLASFPHLGVRGPSARASTLSGSFRDTLCWKRPWSACGLGAGIAACLSSRSKFWSSHSLDHSLHYNEAKHVQRHISISCEVLTPTSPGNPPLQQTVKCAPSFSELACLSHVAPFVPGSETFASTPIGRQHLRLF